MDEYFCPNCGAILNDQSGFDPSIGGWTCTECGQQLMDDDVYDGDTFEGVAWYCDGCGALLNRQDGFSDSYDSWTCTECGHFNGLSEEDIIDGKHFTCPECGSTLNNQSGFNAYADDWECTSCGAKLTHGYSDDDFTIVEENKTVCPKCDADLNAQWGFSAYDEDWTCSECGSRLHRDYSSDEFEVIDQSEEGEEELLCPNCDADLNEQWGFSDDEEDWTCEECGAKLHRDFLSDDFEVVYDEDEDIDDNDEDEYDDVDDEKDDDDEDINGTGTCEESPSFYHDSIVSPKDKSSLRKIRLKAFFMSRKRISIGYESSDLIGKHYEEVKLRLYNQAFKSIRLISKKDIYVHSAYSDGEVESITINGDHSFSSQDTVAYDSEIIVTYHEKMEIEISFSQKNLRKENYAAVQRKFEELGFVNITVRPRKDLVTGWIKKDGAVEAVSILNTTDYKKGAIFKYDVPIVIEYHTFK